MFTPGLVNGGFSDSHMGPERQMGTQRLLHHICDLTIDNGGKIRVSPSCHWSCFLSKAEPRLLLHLAVCSRPRIQGRPQKLPKWIRCLHQHAHNCMLWLLALAMFILDDLSRKSQATPGNEAKKKEAEKAPEKSMYSFWTFICLSSSASGTCRDWADTCWVNGGIVEIASGWLILWLMVCFTDCVGGVLKENSEDLSQFCHMLVLWHWSNT